MGRIKKSVLEMIGHTPLLEPVNYMAAKKITNARILAKMEYLNPAGSTKDEKGLLKPGGAIIEPTSGNTGIGLASAAAARGYRAYFVMPDTMSRERIAMLEAYGARVVLTPGAEGMSGSIRKAKEMAKETEGAFVPGQFENRANAEAHYRTTGPEIWEDADGKVDIFVAGVGSGGTITGVGSWLKEKKPSVQVVAVEPASSASYGPSPYAGSGRGSRCSCLFTRSHGSSLAHRFLSHTSR